MKRQKRTKVMPFDGKDSEPVSLDSVWEEFEERPCFFCSLSLAKDGGFGNVHKLFGPDKFWKAPLALGFLVMNFTVILSWNLFSMGIRNWLVEPNTPVPGLIVDLTQSLLCNRMLGYITTKRLHPEVLLAIFELTILCILLVRMMIVIWAVRSRHAPRRWYAISVLFWEILPDLMTISGMRLLGFVAPSIFIPALSYEIQAAANRSLGKCGLPLLRFLALHLTFAVIGVECFAIKFCSTTSFIQLSDNNIKAVFGALAFLNQMLGIVQVCEVLQDRLFVFIFGGEDSFLNDREVTVQRVWLAMLARRIWEEAGRRRNRIFWFLAVMLSYSDTDFQTLTLHEDALVSSFESRKNNVILHGSKKTSMDLTITAKESPW